MSIPNIEKMRKIAQLSNDPSGIKTIACASCKEPLWDIVQFERYGDRFVMKPTHIKSRDGVPAYSDYWESNQKTPKRLDCPFCGEHYLKAVQVKDEGGNLHTIAVPYCPQLEGV